MRFRRYTSILALFLLAISVTFITSCFEQKPTERDPEAENTEVEGSAETPEPPAAPGYKNLVDGKNISLDDMKGQVLLIDFWATWCAPCRREIPAFIELYDKYKDKNVTIVGVSMDSGEAVVEKFIKANKMNYPVIMTTRELQAKYEKAINQRIRAIPTTIIVNQKGEIASVLVGARPKSVFEQEIQKLLAEG